MALLERIQESALGFLPLGATLVIAVVVLFVVSRILERREKVVPGHRFRNQLVMLGLSFAALLAVVLALPVPDSVRSDLLGLIGILLSAAIALSSTTLIGNAMAGLMIRAVSNFRMGDFIRVEEHFGRVSERGLVHTEIQTKERELTTLPNLYLVTHPVTVIRTSGTIIAATVSLGYDVPRSRIKELLLEAAARAELGDPFVQVTELGDFSVTYRVAGLLTEVKLLFTAQSRLRGEMMDVLHEGGIEIVSPTFMNTRSVEPAKQFIPVAESKAEPEHEDGESAPEAIVFDKADQAEALEQLRHEHKTVCEEIEVQRGALEAEKDEAARARLERRLATLESRKSRLEQMIAASESEDGSPG